MKEPQANSHPAKLAEGDPPTDLSKATKLVGVIFALGVGIVMTMAISVPWFLVGVLTHADNVSGGAPIWWITLYICLSLLTPVPGLMTGRRFYSWYIIREKAKIEIEWLKVEGEV
jgi:hypothetical protein